MYLEASSPPGARSRFIIALWLKEQRRQRSKRLVFRLPLRGVAKQPLRDAPVDAGGGFVIRN